MNLPLNIDIQQILLHLFNFVLLTAGLYFLLYKPVKDFMEKREAYYQELDAKAHAKQEKVESLQAEYEQKLQVVEQEIQARKSEAAKELEAFRIKETQRVKADAEKILADARVEAVRTQEKVIAQAQSEIADMAAEATKKLVYASVPEAFEGFLSEVEKGVE